MALIFFYGLKACENLLVGVGAAGCISPPVAPGRRSLSFAAPNESNQSKGAEFNIRFGPAPTKGAGSLPLVRVDEGSDLSRAPRIDSPSARRELNTERVACCHSAASRISPHMDAAPRLSRASRSGLSTLRRVLNMPEQNQVASSRTRSAFLPGPPRLHARSNRCSGPLIWLLSFGPANESDRRRGATRGLLQAEEKVPTGTARQDRLALTQ